MKDFIFLFIINRFSGADTFTDFALSSLKISAVFFIENRIPRNGLGKCPVNCLAVAKPRSVVVVDDFLRAFFFTDAARCAQFLIDTAGFFPHCDIKIANIPFDSFNFAVRQQGDIVILTYVHHFGGQNTCRAVQRGESFIDLSHMPTDGAFPFHQVNVVACLGKFQGSCNACNSSTQDQCVGINGNRNFLKRDVMDNSFHGAIYQSFRFLGSCNLIIGRPGSVFANIRHLKQERV